MEAEETYEGKRQRTAPSAQVPSRRRSNAARQLSALSPAVKPRRSVRPTKIEDAPGLICASNLEAALKRRSSQRRNASAAPAAMPGEGSGVVDAIIFEACWPAPLPSALGRMGARPRATMAGRGGHVPSLNGPHPGCPGTSNSGEAPVLAALILDRVEAIHIYPATISARTTRRDGAALHTGVAAWTAHSRDAQLGNAPLMSSRTVRSARAALICVFPG